MLTLYTAVGSLKFERTNGKPVPYIINNEKEYGMSKEELLVWSCLAFQILTYPELEQVVERNCADSGQSISLPLSHYLNRLLLRGLLVKGMGVSAVDALYHLLGTLTITPVEDRFLPRLGSALLLSLKGQVRFRDIPRLLRRVNRRSSKSFPLPGKRLCPRQSCCLVWSVASGSRRKRISWRSCTPHLPYPCRYRADHPYPVPGAAGGQQPVFEPADPVPENIDPKGDRLCQNRYLPGWLPSAQSAFSASFLDASMP